MARRLLTLALVAVLVIAAVLLVDNPTLEEPQQQAPQQNTPGAIITAATTRQYDANGQLQYVLQVDRAEQYFRFNQQDKPLPTSRGYTDLSSPRLVLHSDSNPQPWHFSADHGRTENKGNLITLWGNVVAEQALAGGGQYRIETSRLRVEPLLQQATSQQPVTIRSPQGLGNSTGMSIDMPQQTVTLNSQVKATYEAN